MNVTPTIDDLTRAITGLMDAHRKYDAGLAKAKHNGDYSWDYSGHHADAVSKAHDELATTLNEYIDARVEAVLEQRQAE